MLPQMFTFNEGLAVGKLIGIVTAFPADASQTILFQIVGVLGFNTVSKFGAPVSVLLLQSTSRSARQCSGLGPCSWATTRATITQRSI